MNQAVTPLNLKKNKPEIIIVGAGVSSICLAYQLKKAGIHSFTIYEKTDEIGGTWRDNSYPGAECDVPSVLYSYSFELNPHWTQKFSPQAEILNYLQHCVKKFDLRRHIQFNTEISTADFDKSAGLWRIKTTDNQELNANVFISAIGQLSVPKYPDIPGLKSFKGNVFHSARWNHDKEILKDKNVAVIGSGASAVQFIPHVAQDAGHLTVFQRSPHWIVPKPERDYAEWEHRMFESYPWVQRMYRYMLYWQMELAHGILHKGSWLGKRAESICKWHINKHLSDPVLQEKMVPDYPVGCKRILISNNYYPTFAQNNVDMVTTGIKKITPKTIVTNNGDKYPVDTLILGTGYEATEFLTPMEVTGVDGLSLQSVWKEGAEAHLGMTVPGFPNFYMIYGPNTNLGHNSVIFMFESQVNYIVKGIQALIDNDLKYIDVKKEVMIQYNLKLQHDVKQTVWDSDCGSWYKNEAGKITNNWPHTSVNYWWNTLELKLNEYNQEKYTPVAEDVVQEPLNTKV